MTEFRSQNMKMNIFSFYNISVGIERLEKIVVEVIEAVKGWRELANRQGISKREIDIFLGVLDERSKQHANI